MEEAEFAAALLDADDHLFALERPTPRALAVLFAAHIGFVDFERPTHRQWCSVLHRGPNAMAEVPGSFVAPADHAADLVSADALPGLAHKIGRSKPSWQRELRILKYGTGQNGELIAA